MVNEQANVKITLNSQGAQKELGELQGEMKRLIALKTKAEKAGDVTGWKKIDGELKKVNKQANKLVRENQDIEKTLKNINGASLNDLQKAKRQLTNQVNKLNRNTDEYTKKSKQLKAVKKEISGIYSETSAATGMTGKLKNLASQLLPAFGFAAIIGGAIRGAKALFNLYQQTAKARREAERLTGLSGQPLADFTAKVQATAKTFEQDFNKVLVSVNSISQTMGISLDEALQKVNDGFLTGADSSGEFLDILKEYGPQFKAAGLSADESIALISQQVKSGIYSDKGIDAIKEATISIREMTPATRAAIEGIGISSVTMQQQLRNGTITVFDAIQQISSKMAELPPQSSEVGTALADIFRGAGEDAGLEYIAMLGTAEMSLEKLKAGAGENAVAQEKLLQANQKLNEAWSELMGTGTGTFDAIKAFAIDLAATGIGGIAKGIADVRDWFITMYNESLPVRAGFQYMLATWRTGFLGVKIALQSLWEQLKLGGNLIKSILTFDVEGIKNAITTWGDNMTGKVADNATKLADIWKNAWNNTIDGKLTAGKQFQDPATSQQPATGFSGPPTFDNNQEGDGTGELGREETPAEMESLGDPRIANEVIYTDAVLEQSQLRERILNKEQEAAEQRAENEEKLQQQKRDAYLSTLDTIIGVFGEESRIGKAALLAKQAYAVAETIINIAKGTGESAAAAPFPANIPLIIGFVAQVAGLIGTIKSATGKVKTNAEGRYPVTGSDGKTYSVSYSGRPQTGFYDGPQLGIFNEVSGQPELVVDGKTTRELRMNYPQIVDAILRVRDGRPVTYAEGKYPAKQVDYPSGSSSIDTETGKMVAGAVLELKEEIKRFQRWKPTVYTQMIKKDLETLNEIENKRGL
ncbi:Phage-related minor tail protein [Tangfeifania diversioriginum]|uniref:Phage-related minor tail protein n=1 Tax=Tangfeifania diversioriginum TaxID=1168035 RepID=A0A1M6FCN6_9BACT|nr:phage tail tape measure protein [Tangfeifania diversioriginum]SHI95480.1 Phage-related minor tail protein [Tangfeifania diversioriginum]